MTRSPIFLAFLAFLAAGCAPDGLAVGVPWLELPSEVLVEDAVFGEPNDVAVPVTNSGTATAAVDASASPSPPFTAAAETLYVEPATGTVLPLLFTPVDFEPAEGRLVVTTGIDTWELPIAATVDRDRDDDGYETPAAGGDDCDDLDPLRHPDAEEACDGIDQDCDGVVDDAEAAPTWWPDLDADGHGDPAGPSYQGCDPPPGSVETADDCDDGLATVNPDATELWYDGVDQDCDGNDDDQDLDGEPVPLDCDDLDPAVNSAATEVWYDGTDQDCDGNDDDQDGDGDAFPADCDDVDAAVGPSAPELDDGVDQDCDLLVDEGLWARGTLIVTEMMEDPAAVSDADGRWIEFHNPTDGHVELAGVTVTVGSQPASPLPVVIDPGGTVVLCTHTDPARNGGVACGGSITWSGGARSVVVRGGGLDLDEVDWSGWPFPVGASAELRPISFSPDLNDVLTAWCSAASPFGVGDLGTPGSVAAPCQ